MLCLVLALITFSGACASEEKPSEKDPVWAITLTGVKTAYVGDTVELFVGLTRDGVAEDASAVVLTIRQGEGLASLTGRTLKALAAGTVELEASHPDIDVTATHTVLINDMVEIVFTQETYQISTYDISTDNTVVLDFSAEKNGEELSADEIEWSSSDESTATVAEGVVSCLKGGTVQITAVYGAYRATCEVVCKDYTDYTVIHTAEELRTLVAENLSGKFVLGNDIDLNGVVLSDDTYIMSKSIGMTEQDTFKGVFDGNGFTIKHFSIEPSSWTTSLFGGIEGGRIENLTVLCDSFGTGSNNAVLSHWIYGESVIDNVYVSAGSLVYNAPYAGAWSGIFSANLWESTVRNCTETADWREGNETERFARIARNQGSAVYENNYSLINNAPDSLGNTGIAGITSVPSNFEDIILEKGYAQQLHGIDGYSVIFTSDEDEIATVTAQNFVEGISEGVTFIKAVVNNANGTAIKINGRPLSVNIPVTIISDDLRAPENLWFAGTEIYWDAVIGAQGYSVDVVKDETVVYTTDVTETVIDVKTYLTLDGAEYAIRIYTRSNTGRGTTYAEQKLNTIGSLESFRAIKDGPDKDYIVIQDIDCDGAVLKNIGDVSGILEGNGKEIRNFSKEGDWGEGGLFYTVSGEVRNLTLSMTELKLGSQSGGVVYYLTGKLTNIHLYAESVVWDGSSEGNNSAGMLAGANAGGIIQNCLVVANWSAESSAEHIGGVQMIARQASDSGYNSGNKVVFNNAPDGLGNSLVASSIRPQIGEITLTVNAEFMIQGEANFTYDVENPSCATVDETGNITALATGETYLKVTVSDYVANGKNAVFRVKITVVDDGVKM